MPCTALQFVRGVTNRRKFARLGQADATTDRIVNTTVIGRAPKKSSPQRLGSQLVDQKIDKTAYP